MANVLIVDDDPDLTTAVVVVLTSEGHETRTAFHGREGLARVYEVRPDVILLDVEMPDLDGAAMIRRLRTIEPGGDSIPFVLMSGLEHLPKIAEAFGTPYFLRKPFATDALLLMLARALREPWMPPHDRD